MTSFCFSFCKFLLLYGSKSNFFTMRCVNNIMYCRYMKRSLVGLCGRFYG